MSDLGRRTRRTLAAGWLLLVVAVGCVGVTAVTRPRGVELLLVAVLTASAAAPLLAVGTFVATRTMVAESALRSTPRAALVLASAVAAALLTAALVWLFWQMQTSTR